MAVRTSASDIQEILPDGNGMENSAIEAYIEIASTMVDDLDASLLTTAKLREIERWLTAHLISITKDRQSIREKLGDAEIAYPKIFGEGLKASTYGQMVIQLDTTGAILKFGKKALTMLAITSFD